MRKVKIMAGGNKIVWNFHGKKSEIGFTNFLQVCAVVASACAATAAAFIWSPGARLNSKKYGASLKKV